MQTSHVAIVAAAAFIVLSWLNVNTNVGSIQSDIHTRAQRAIAAVLEDADDVRVRADGRDLVLTGTVSSETVKAKAESRVSGLRGVRVVSNLIEVEEVVETAETSSWSHSLTTVPYRLVVSLTSSGAVLEGLVHDEPTRSALLALVAARPVDGDVLDTLEVDSNTHPQWRTAVPEIVRAVVALRDVELRFADHEISVKARAGSPDGRDRALAAIRSAVPYGVILQTALTAPLTAAAAQCVRRFAELQTQRPVVFLPTSAALLPNSAASLDALAATLQECPDTPIEIAGYSESTRDYGAALRISQARAETIEQQLVARGVDDDRLSAIGYGVFEAGASDAADAHITSPQMQLTARAR